MLDEPSECTRLDELRSCRRSWRLSCLEWCREDCRRGGLISSRSRSLCTRREECRRAGGRGASTVGLRGGGPRDREAESDGSISSSPRSLQLSSLDGLRLPPLDTGERTDTLPPDEVLPPGKTCMTRSAPVRTENDAVLCLRGRAMSAEDSFGALVR